MLVWRCQQKQHEDQEKELEEANKDAEELASLVRTKSEATKVLHTKLAQAKKTIADLKAEVETLRSNNRSSSSNPVASAHTA